LVAAPLRLAYHRGESGHKRRGAHWDHGIGHIDLVEDTNVDFENLTHLAFDQGPLDALNDDAGADTAHDACPHRSLGA
jgi:hypothetical protein